MTSLYVERIERVMEAHEANVHVTRGRLYQIGVRDAVAREAIRMSGALTLLLSVALLAVRHYPDKMLLNDIGWVVFWYMDALMAIWLLVSIWLLLLNYRWGRQTREHWNYLHETLAALRDRRWHVEQEDAFLEQELYPGDEEEHEDV